MFLGGFFGIDGFIFFALFGYAIVIIAVLVPCFVYSIVTGKGLGEDES